MERDEQENENEEEEDVNHVSPSLFFKQQNSKDRDDPQALKSHEIIIRSRNVSTNDLKNITDIEERKSPFLSNETIGVEGESTMNKSGDELDDLKELIKLRDEEISRLRSELKREKENRDQEKVRYIQSLKGKIEEEREKESKERPEDKSNGDREVRKDNEEKPQQDKNSCTTISEEVLFALTDKIDAVVDELSDLKSKNYELKEAQKVQDFFWKKALVEKDKTIQSLLVFIDELEAERQASLDKAKLKYKLLLEATANDSLVPDEQVNNKRGFKDKKDSFRRGKSEVQEEEKEGSKGTEDHQQQVSSDDYGNKYKNSSSKNVNGIQKGKKPKKAKKKRVHLLGELDTLRDKLAKENKDHRLSTNFHNTQVSSTSFSSSCSSFLFGLWRQWGNCDFYICHEVH